MWHHTGYCMTHQQGWLYTQMLIPSCLKSRVTGNTDSPTTSAEGQAEMTHSLCQQLPHVFADNRQLLHSRNPWVCCTLGSAGGMIWWGYSQIWLLLLLLVLPACLLPWSCFHTRPPCLTSVPLSKQGALCLCTAVGLPPSLPQPGPRPSQHQPSCMFTSDSAKEHIWEHLQALVHNTAVTLSAQKNNVQELLLGTCSRRLQRSCHIIICDLATRLVQVPTEQVSSENSDSNS